MFLNTHKCVGIGQSTGNISGEVDGEMYYILQDLFTLRELKLGIVKLILDFKKWILIVRIMFPWLKTTKLKTIKIILQKSNKNGREQGRKS